MSNETDSYQNSSNNIENNRARNPDKTSKAHETVFSTVNLSDDSFVKDDGPYLSLNNLPSGFKSKPYLLIQPVSIWDEINNGKLSYLKHE